MNSTQLLSDLSGKTLLVIGGSGFVGSHIVDQLLQHDVAEVRLFDNFARGRQDNISVALQDPRCRIFDLGGDILQTDILNEAMKGVDGVFHLAALRLLHCHDFPESGFEVNVRGTFNVIQAAIRNDVKRLVFSSSASVYGNAMELPMTEDHPYNNDTFYGATKIAGEHMLAALGKRYGLPWVGLRYMNVYGPRQDYHGAYIAVMHKILDRLERGERPVVFGDGSQQYDFISVEDVARASLCAMRSNVISGNYNVATGIGTSITELAELLIRLSGVESEVQYEPAELTFVTNRIGCPKAAARDLGFQWSIKVDEGMQRLIDWRRQNQDELADRRKKAAK